MVAVVQQMTILAAGPDNFSLTHGCLMLNGVDLSPLASTTLGLDIATH